MREVEINLTLKFRMPENNVNVNGVVMGVRNASAQIYSAIVGCLVSAVEEKAIGEMIGENSDRYIHNGTQNPRQLKTSLGFFQYRPKQLYDKVENKTVVPLRSIGFLPKNRQYTDEAMEGGIGSVVHLSYRWASKEMARLREQAPAASAMTLHRYLQSFSERECSWPDLKNVPYRFLMVDGTKVRLQGERGSNVGLGEMRWALTSLGEKQPFEPVGFWINKSWKEIKQDLMRRLDYSRLEVLFSDGGPGIEEAFLEEGMVHQRCVLHGKREFPYFLYTDGLKKAEQAALVETMTSIPVYHFNKNRLEQLKPEDEPEIRACLEKTQHGFRELIELLAKYPRTRKYVENISSNITTFLTWWLEKKTPIPTDTNAIESCFSLVKNRIWSVGKRWGDKGLLNWLQLTLYKIFHPEMWQDLWSKYLLINPDFRLTSLEVNWRWCNVTT